MVAVPFAAPQAQQGAPQVGVQLPPVAQPCQAADQGLIQRWAGMLPTRYPLRGMQCLPWAASLTGLPWEGS